MSICEQYECIGEILGFPIIMIPIVMMIIMFSSAFVLYVWVSRKG
jgi:hypothetical protein